MHPCAATIQAVAQVIKRCSGELLLTILAAAALYLLFLAGRRMAVIAEFVVDKIAWMASCTMVAYGLEWAWSLWLWCGPICSLAGGPATLPGLTAAHGTAMAAPEVCKVIAGAITVILSVFSCCKPK